MPKKKQFFNFKPIPWRVRLPDAPSPGNADLQIGRITLTTKQLNHIHKHHG